MIAHAKEQAERLVNAGAIAALAATLLGWLPQATAVLTFIWAVIRLYETVIVQWALERLRRWRSG